MSMKRRNKDSENRSHKHDYPIEEVWNTDNTLAQLIVSRLQAFVKWLLIAEMLDALEEDYRRIYPDDDPPFISFFNKITIFSI